MSGKPGTEALPGRAFVISLSALLMVLTIVSLLTRGLNFGVDFTGGTLLERRLERPVTAAEVREVLTGPALADLELSPVVQALDDPRDVLVRVRALEPAEVERVDRALAEAFGQLDVLRTELVGPVIGAELVRKAIWALLLSFVGVLIYLSFRFQFKYGAVAVAAVVHDALVVLGVVSFIQQELDTAFIAAILTVVGYSLNATIIIFDRVRENMRLRKREPVADIVGRSVRQTLSRSINTTFTTLLTVGALLFFGGPTIRGFALALAVGLIAGTYSSVLLAGHLWALWKEREEARRGADAGVPARQPS